MSRHRRAGGSATSDWAGLAGLLAGSGVLHLVRPELYTPTVPPRLGSPRAWVMASGLAELGCAGALASARTRRAGAWATAGLLVGVFPANVHMARAGHPGLPANRVTRLVGWARLPLQVPLVRRAVAVARSAGPRGG